MIFRHMNDGLQIPAGTHGLYQPGVNGALIGILKVADGDDTWTWKNEPNVPFAFEFLLKPNYTGTDTFPNGPYKYPDSDLGAVPNNPVTTLPNLGFCYAIFAVASNGTETHVGWMVRNVDCSTIHWASKGSAARIDFPTGGHLRFKRDGAQFTSGKWRQLTSSRKVN